MGTIKRLHIEAVNNSKSSHFSSRGIYMSNRPRIPNHIKSAVIARSNGLCECCGVDVTVDNHHILMFSKGGPHTPDNLLALCPSCHRQIPLFLDKDQQKLLQEWHNNTLRGNSSLNHQLSSCFAYFNFGAFSVYKRKDILNMNGQNIITIFNVNDRFYLNTIMLEGFNPQLLVLTNRVILDGNNYSSLSRPGYLEIRCNNTGKYIYKIYIKNDEIFVNLRFQFRNETYEFNEEETIIRGTKITGGMRVGPGPNPFITIYIYFVSIINRDDRPYCMFSK